MKKIKLSDKWNAFISIVFSPFTLATLAITFLLGYVLNKQTDPAIVAILSFLLSISAGVAGGILQKSYDEQFDEQLIVARGKSAIRSLYHILFGVGILEKRVKEFLEAKFQDGTKIDKKELQANLEEIISTAQLIKLQVLGSIDNWQDALPEEEKASLQAISSTLSEWESTLTQLYEINRDAQENPEQANPEEYKELVSKLVSRLEQAEQKIRSLSKDYGIVVGTGPKITFSGSNDFSTYQGPLVIESASSFGGIVSRSRSEFDELLDTGIHLPPQDNDL